MANIKIGDLYAAAVTARNYSEFMCQVGKWLGIPPTDARVNDITLEDLVRKGSLVDLKNANCAIFDVSKQRELLLALAKDVDEAIEDSAPLSLEDIVDIFIANNCGALERIRQLTPLETKLKVAFQMHDYENWKNGEYFGDAEKYVEVALNEIADHAGRHNPDNIEWMAEEIVKLFAIPDVSNSVVCKINMQPENCYYRDITMECKGCRNNPNNCC